MLAHQVKVTPVSTEPTISVVNKSYQLTRKVRAVFHDISKAVDNWYEGLLFKLKQNSVTSNVVKIFNEQETKSRFECFNIRSFLT